MVLQLTEKWLKFIAVIHIIAGLLLPLLVFTQLTAPYFEYLESLFPNSNSGSLKFLVGVFGPTVASWGLLFYYSVSKAFQSRTRSDWWFLVSAVLVWGILDSVFSSIFSINAHWLLNGSVMLLIFTPLLILKPQFSHEKTNV